MSKFCQRVRPVNVRGAPVRHYRPTGGPRDVEILLKGAPCKCKGRPRETLPAHQWPPRYNRATSHELPVAGRPLKRSRLRVASVMAQHQVQLFSPSTCPNSPTVKESQRPEKFEESHQRAPSLSSSHVRCETSVLMFNVSSDGHLLCHHLIFNDCAIITSDRIRVLSSHSLT